MGAGFWRLNLCLKFSCDTDFEGEPKETGEEKTILFGLTGTGYFDMVAYQKFNDGVMSDYIPTDEEIAKSLADLPQV